MLGEGADLEEALEGGVLAGHADELPAVTAESVPVGLIGAALAPPSLEAVLEPRCPMPLRLERLWLLLEREPARRQSLDPRSAERIAKRGR